MAKKVNTNQSVTNVEEVIGVHIPIVTTSTKPLLLVVPFRNEYYVVGKYVDATIPEVYEVNRDQLFKIIKMRALENTNLEYKDNKEFNRLLNRYFVVMTIPSVEHDIVNLCDPSTNLYTSLVELNKVVLTEDNGKVFQVFGLMTKSKLIYVKSSSDTNVQYGSTEIFLNLIVNNWPNKKTECWGDDFRRVEESIFLQPDMVFDLDTQINVHVSVRGLEFKNTDTPTRVNINYSSRYKAEAGVPLSLTFINTLPLYHYNQTINLHNVTGVFDKVNLNRSDIDNVRVYLRNTSIINSIIHGYNGIAADNPKDRNTQFVFGGPLTKIECAGIKLRDTRSYNLLSNKRVEIKDITIDLKAVDNEYYGLTSDDLVLVGIGVNKEVHTYHLGFGDNDVNYNTIITMKLDLCSDKYYNHSNRTIGIALLNMNSTNRFDYYIEQLGLFIPLNAFLDRQLVRRAENLAYDYNVAACNAFKAYAEGTIVARSNYKNKQYDDCEQEG